MCLEMDHVEFRKVGVGDYIKMHGKWAGEKYMDE